MLLKELLKRIFYPKDLTCSVCKRESFSGESICEGCKAIMPYNNKSVCGHCGRATPYPIEYCDYCKDKQTYLDMARSVYEYEYPLNILVRRLKYSRERFLAEDFAREMLPLYFRSIGYADCILFVPMTDKRKRERGYNQSEELAKAFSRLSEVPILDDVLVKTKDTDSQVGLDRKERLKNVKGSVSVRNRALIKNKRVLIIDDVMTTGSTLEVLAEKLKDAGASEVVAVTVASVTSKRWGDALRKEEDGNILREKTEQS